MEQNIIVAIIGLVIFSYIGYKLYKMATSKGRENPCKGCCGCKNDPSLKAGDCDKRIKNE